MAISPASLGDSPARRGFRGVLGGVDRFTLALALISLLGAALVLAREAVYGAALHADSVFYIYAARNLLAGDGFQILHANGRIAPLVHWPPLYPLALALPGIAGIDARAFAGPLNAALFALTAFAVGRWARRRLESKALALWGCAAVALAAPLADMASWALAETPFILLSTLALIQADDFLRDGRRAPLLWMAALSALAWLTRYIGYALIGAIVALVLLRGGMALRDRARAALFYGAVAALPMALWLARNILLDGTPIGTRREQGPELSDLADGAAFVGGWFAPDFLAARFPFPALGMAAIGAGALCAGVAWALISSRGAEWRGRRSLGVFAAFAAVYAACVLHSLFAVPTPHYDRYWVVIYIPALAVALLVLDRFISVRGGERRVFADIRAWLENRRARLDALALAASLALWLALGAAQNAADIRRANSESVANAYNAEWWTNSETLKYLRENPVVGERIISNKTHMVYLHADAGGAYGSLPEFSLPTANASLDDVLDDAVQTSNGGAIRVVWLSRWYKNDEASYGVETLRASPRLEVEAELADGVVFRVKPEVARPDGDNSANTAPESP